jgi:predicted transposase/invertase (TIGR01784 family)
MYDDICKFIALNYSRDLTSWLLGEPIELTVLESTELFVDPIRADSIIFLQSRDIIVHIEFQTRPQKDVPFRMADYRLRIHRLFPKKKIYQVVIYLKKTSSKLARINTFELPEMQHRYNVIRLWEVPTEELLKSSGILPFAVLSKTNNPQDVLEQVARRIDKIADRGQQSNIAASTAIIAGLVLDTMVIKRLLKEEIMKESVIYQEIEATGEAKGLQRGLEQGLERGLEQGLEQGRQKEAALLLRLLGRRFGEIPANLTEQIRSLPVESLETLGEALLDFQSLSDLVAWLES